jgi:hypothetical protein
MNNCTTLYVACGIWDGVQDLNNEDISPQIAAMQKDLKDSLIHAMVRPLEMLGQCTYSSEATM